MMSVYDETTHQWNTAPYSTSFESDYYTSSDFDVEFDVPESYQVVMPGDITSRDSAEQGRKMVTARAANTREFVFAGPNLKSNVRCGMVLRWNIFIPVMILPKSCGAQVHRLRL